MSNSSNLPCLTRNVLFLPPSPICFSPSCHCSSPKPRIHSHSTPAFPHVPHPSKVFSTFTVFRIFLPCSLPPTRILVQSIIIYCLYYSLIVRSPQSNHCGHLKNIKSSHVTVFCPYSSPMVPFYTYIKILTLYYGLSQTLTLPGPGVAQLVGRCLVHQKVASLSPRSGLWAQPSIGGT